ncbi:MAG: TolC family protein [Janthinobacterium lividum]
MNQYRFLAATVTTGLLAFNVSVHAQISLQSAVTLALKNSPKIKIAQADVAKARAAHGELIDAYVPVVATQAGYGQSTGAPLNVPVIFSITAQSLVFSFAQRDYIRSAQQSIEAAEHLLHNQQIEVVEDTTNTYVALDNALQRQKTLQEANDFADRLVAVTSDRIAAGVDAKVELPKAHRTATQIRLQRLQLQDEIAANTGHLALLTGLPEGGLSIASSSIPALKAQRTDTMDGGQPQDSEGIAAAFSNARAKQYAAFGDHRYLLRPQVNLSAGYSRVATELSSYGNYYPRYAGTAENPNSQNSYGFGLQITLPLLDLAHRSKSRQSAADAARSFAEAEQQRGVFREGRARLRNSALELQLRSEMAHDEQEIARDQLETLQIQLQASAGSLNGPQTTPKDLLNAQLQERQRYLDVLNVELQLRQTQVNLLRQTDGLSVWVLGSSSTGSNSLTSLGTVGAQPSVTASPANGAIPQGSSLPGTSRP